MKFLRRFKQLLNPAQVFDLMNGGPGLGYVFFILMIIHDLKNGQFNEEFVFNAFSLFITLYFNKTVL